MGLAVSLPRIALPRTSVGGTVRDLTRFDPLPLHTVLLRITGHFDRAACTAALGLSPLDLQARPEIPLREDTHPVEWLYGVVQHPCDDMGTVVAEVLEEIWPARQCIVDYVTRNHLNAGFACAITVHDERPLYGLSSETIQRLCFFGFEFRWDVFDFS